MGKLSTLISICKQGSGFAKAVMEKISQADISHFIPDKVYLKMQYRFLVGNKLDLKDPKTYNEKLQWLKLYDHRSEYIKMVDKYEVKKYVSDKIGERYIIPTLGAWEHFDDIDFDVLPLQFVLKTTHDSGSVVICRDKNSLDKKTAKKKLERALSRQFFYYSREWPYKNVPRKIIAEQYMEDPELHELRDYKFFCFNGVCKCFKVDFDRFIDHRANYYDTNGTFLPDIGEAICPPDPNKNIILPRNMDKMIELAETLSKDIPFLRVDFYNVNGQIFFGELTFFPAAGMGTFINDKCDSMLGSWLTLPER